MSAAASCHHSCPSPSSSQSSSVRLHCRYNLSQHARSYPALRRVVIPRVAAALSTPRLLVLEYVDGVPLLDVAMLDLVRRACMHVCMHPS